MVRVHLGSQKLLAYFFKKCNDCLRSMDKSFLNRKRCKEYRERRRLKVLSYYSGSDIKCFCCKEDKLEFLSIDHINGGGTKQKKLEGTRDMYALIIKFKFPKGFRVLCHNCNQSYGFYGYCPHNIKAA